MHNYTPSLVQQYQNSLTAKVRKKTNLTDQKRYEQINKNSSGDEIANVNFFYNIAHVEASAYAH